MKRGANHPTYIVTVKYGKEAKAELEIGDSLYEADPSLRIVRETYGGVLTVYTRLKHDEFLKHLLKHPPATVERVVRVDFCCGREGFVECFLNEYSRRGWSFKDVYLGRYGFLKHEGGSKLLKFLKDMTTPTSDKILDVEPLSDLICFSLIREGEDRVVQRRRVELIKEFFNSMR
ncbi:MAG: hypothetical protein J7L55_05555 [Desulfurococcales archaeon]|nr:hypothetical protein [Desulfurococcales archaeon]